MNITPIITQLRAECPSFAQHISTGLDLDLLQGNTTLPTPSAFITVRCDLAAENTAQNVSRQTIRDRLELTLVLDASNGQAPFDQLHALRAELWRALVGFKPDTFYTPLQYGGGRLVSINATRLLYRLRFFAEFQLGRNRATDPAETWHERELDAGRCHRPRRPQSAPPWPRWAPGAGFFRKRKTMTQRINVVPAAGRAVPDPEAGDLLPVTGREVADSAWWRRRQADGDITLSAVQAAQPQEAQ